MAEKKKTALSDGIVYKESSYILIVSATAEPRDIQAAIEIVKAERRAAHEKTPD